jgi:hypothetical protein
MPVASFLGADAQVANQQAPTELLQGTQMPAHQQGSAAASLTATGIAIPSAEQLAGVAPAAAIAGEAVQHNQVVGQVLAEALDGGHVGGVNIDSALASLPGHSGAPLAGFAVANGDHGGSSLAADMLSFAMQHSVHEVIAVHADAAPTA